MLGTKSEVLTSHGKLDVRHGKKSLKRSRRIRCLSMVKFQQVKIGRMLGKENLDKSRLIGC